MSVKDQPHWIAAIGRPRTVTRGQLDHWTA
jgi:hypothetical protein